MFNSLKCLRFPALFLLFLISFLGLTSSPSRAQVSCGNAGNDCDVDADCSDGNPCNGVELCFASGGVDTFSAPTCHCASSLPPDNTVSCASDGATVADRSRPEQTLLSTPTGARWRMDICRELR